MPGGRGAADFYASVESQLIASGRMRRDVAPADAPYTTDDLVRDFERVALYDEYTDVDGRFVHQQAPARLRRWDRAGARRGDDRRLGLARGRRPRPRQRRGLHPPARRS